MVTELSPVLHSACFDLACLPVSRVFVSGQIGLVDGGIECFIEGMGFEDGRSIVVRFMSPKGGDVFKESSGEWVSATQIKCLAPD